MKDKEVKADGKQVQERAEDHNLQNTVRLRLPSSEKVGKLWGRGTKGALSYPTSICSISPPAPWHMGIPPKKVTTTFMMPMLRASFLSGTGLSGKYCEM